MNIQPKVTLTHQEEPDYDTNLLGEPNNRSPFDLDDSVSDHGSDQRSGPRTSPDRQSNDTEKAFARVLKKTKPDMLSGTPAKDYLPWKYSVEGEVKTLNLSPDQWFELLKHRTTGRALILVKNAGALVGELTMDEIVASIWKEMDRLYQPKMKRSDDILNDLLQGPVVFHNNLEKLEEFSQSCGFMDTLSKSNVSLSAVSDLPSTMVGLVRRLDKTLMNEWLDEENRVKLSMEHASLSDFTIWIGKVFKKEQDKNALYNTGSDSKTDKGGPIKNPRDNTQNTRP